MGAGDKLAAYVCKLGTICSSEDRLHNPTAASPAHNVPTSTTPMSSAPCQVLAVSRWIDSSTGRPGG